MMFDAAVYLVMFIAVVAGFNSGFLRSMMTILGYVAAMPIAVAAMSLVSPKTVSGAAAQSHSLWGDKSLLFFAIFLVAGMVLGALLRLAVSETTGSRIGIPDRLAGSLLGAVRVGLVAVLLVLVFDRLIPHGREPAFLRDSQLRPYLSIAARAGLRSLPPETTAFIDQLKREHRM
jgi:membrane protein required for colicin V production